MHKLKPPVVVVSSYTHSAHPAAQTCACGYITSIQRHGSRISTQAATAQLNSANRLQAHTKIPLTPQLPLPGAVQATGYHNAEQMAPSKQPTLPEKGAKKNAAGSKKAASSTALPINHAQFITLEDGTQVPVKLPPGMPADQAQGILTYLKTNPEAAKAAWAQAQAIMTNPGLANAFINMQSQADPSRSNDVYEALKDDPELAVVFDDVKANGPGALQKYWDDTELMSKISSKLRNMKLSQQPPAAAAASKGAAAKPVSESISSLHDAAKWGDEEAAVRLLNEGADVNGVNERGISPLGVAVGFNRGALVTLLLDAGADLEARDGAGNTVMHYAAGYGRLALVKLLLERGADINARNKQKLKPVDAAKMNGEKHIVSFLEQQEHGEAAAADTPAAEEAAAPAATS